MDAICDFYSELRSASQDNSLPVTVRCLETIIRLSTAAAKARLAEGLSPFICLENATLQKLCDLLPRLQQSSQASSR